MSFRSIILWLAHSQISRITPQVQNTFSHALIGKFYDTGEDTLKRNKITIFFFNFQINLYYLFSKMNKYVNLSASAIFSSYFHFLNFIILRRDFKFNYYRLCHATMRQLTLRIFFEQDYTLLILSIAENSSPELVTRCKQVFCS